MITEQQAQRLAHDWIDAFNQHDLDGVLAHYADDVEFTSPVVVELLGEPSGTIRGKENVRAYFERGLAAYPNLGFELLEVLTGVDSLTIFFRSQHRDTLGAEVMVLDDQARIARVMAHYGARAT